MKNKENTKGRLMMFGARFVAYFILIFLTILCLFSFYMMIINASRSNAELQAGFTPWFSTHLLENLTNAWNDASINIPRGMLNSFLIAACCAVLTTYFSALIRFIPAPLLLQGCCARMPCCRSAGRYTSSMRPCAAERC